MELFYRKLLRKLDIITSYDKVKGMNNELTQKEIESVKTLIRLGDSEELAIQTILEDRPYQAMKEKQLSETIQD